MQALIFTNYIGDICEKISAISVEKLSSGFYTHSEKHLLSF